jgi:hypothetical protein
MATFTITVTNSVNFVGIGDRTIWDDATWDEDVWDTGNDTRYSFFKNLDSETITLSDALAKKPFRTIDAGTMVATITAASLTRYDGFGDFVYVRPGGDWDDNFSKTADGSDGWSKTSDGTDDWSGV